MNVKSIALLGGLLGGGAGIIAGLSGDEVGKVGLDGGAIVEPIKEVTAVDVADRAWVSPTGKAIHVVGVSATEATILTDTPVGAVVVVPNLTTQAECQVVFEAKVKGTLPDLPKEFQKCLVRDNTVDFGPIMDPVQIQGSKSGDSIFWIHAMRGQCCADALSLPGYKGSSMNEFLALSSSDKARMLRTTGQCPTDGGFRECTVPFGDPKATPGAEVQFPIQLAGRDDLKIMPSTGGIVKARQELPVKLDGGVVKELVEIEP